LDIQEREGAKSVATPLSVMKFVAFEVLEELGFGT